MSAVAWAQADTWVGRSQLLCCPAAVLPRSCACVWGGFAVVRLWLLVLIRRTRCIGTHAQGPLCVCWMPGCCMLALLLSLAVDRLRNRVPSWLVDWLLHQLAREGRVHLLTCIARAREPRTTRLHVCASLYCVHTDRCTYAVRGNALPGTLLGSQVIR